MVVYSSVPNTYIDAVRNLAVEIWGEYPDVVDICVKDIKNFKSVILPKAFAEQVNSTIKNYWYDKRLPIMAINRKSWLNTEIFGMSPSKDEIARMKLAEVPRIIRWMTPELLKKYQKEVNKISALHNAMLVDEFIEFCESDGEQGDLESQNDFSEASWLEPINSCIRTDGAGWIDRGEVIKPFHKDANSDWASEVVAQFVKAPYSIRKSIREYVDAIDRLKGGNKDLKLAEVTISDAINVIHSEFLSPFKLDIFNFEAPINIGYLKNQAVFWSKYLASAYHIPGEFTVWERSGLENNIDEFITIKYKFMNYIRGKTRDAFPEDYGNIDPSLDLVQWHKHIRDFRDAMSQDMWILEKLNIKKQFMESRTYDEGNLYRRKEPLHPQKEKPSVQEKKISSLDKLNDMNGMELVKNHVKKIMDLETINKKRKAQGLPITSLNKHLVLTGNPGTGKTTVARILGEIYKEIGLLSKGHFVEVGQENLVAEYTGQTAKKTAKVIESARGGILFIDEAYSLSGKGKGGFGAEAIEVIVKAMENYRDDLVLIVAGYQSEMENFLNSNEGLRSRFSEKITLPDMSNEQLTQIAISQFREQKYILNGNAKTKLNKSISTIPRVKGFANARAARQLVENIIIIQSGRLMQNSNAELNIILEEDIPLHGQIILDKDIKDKNKIRLEASLAELNKLTGLESIKSEINSIVSLARIARIKQEKGEPAKPVIGHFVFNGNPGTGKTTVARLLGEIFASLGLLSSGHTVEVGRVDLVGEYLGQTAPKVKEKVQSAMGGVLFIDEAYSLQSKNKTDIYGKEAIDTLVQLMENHRDNLVVILAGYKDEMKDLIVMNSGLKSRISYDLDFENYDSSSSLKIFTNLVEANNMIPDEEFIVKASNILITLCGQPGYANARSIRELFEYALKQQALRLNSMQSKRIEISDLKSLKAEDLPEVKKIKVVEKAPLGFI